MKYIYIVTIFFTQLMLGQTVEFDKIIPAAPNAASLAKYAITPVSYYTGIPNIEIPIYSIQAGNILAPISLSYHSGGIKISEESGVVGLGWALNAGGVITRSIGYKDDFDLYLGQSLVVPDPPLNAQGIFNPSATRVRQRGTDCKFPVNGIMTTYPIVPWASTTPTPDLDWAPDTFFYNFNGHSGSFWLDQDGNVHQSKKTDISIKLLNQNQGEWEIKTANGITYEFKQLENTSIVQHIGDGGGYISSWYLTKITDHLGEIVEFIYDTKEYISPIRSFTQNFNFSVGTFTNLGGKPVSTQGVYLSEIKFKNGKITFNYSSQNERLDIKGAYFVNSVRIYREPTLNNFELLKKFDFNYSYFGGGSGGGSPQEGDYYDLTYTLSSDASRRLKLDNIIENNIKEHSFEYYSSTFVPTKTTFAQDYWGYFNGRGGPTTFIPVSVTNPITGTSTLRANRSAHKNNAKEFMLNRITYPTKGYTTFEHELNTYKLTGTVGGSVPITVVKSANNASNGGLVEKTITIGGNGFQLNLANTAFVREEVIDDFNDIQGINRAYQNVSIDDMYVELLNSQGEIIERATFAQMFDPGITHTSTVLGLSDLRTKVFPAGTYTFRSYVNPDHYFVKGNANITLSWEETETDPNKNYGSGGGLRIASISDFDEEGVLQVKREFDYHYSEVIANDTVTSSHGRLMRFPDYSAWFRQIGSQGGIAINNGLQASSSTNLSMEQGSFVGYDQVSVSLVDGDTKNGQTIYKYRNQQDLYFPAGTDFALFEDEFYTFPPIRVPHNGLLYEEENYKLTSGNELKLVNKQEVEHHINGIKDSEFVLSDLYQNPNYVIGGALIAFGRSDNSQYDECDDQSFLFHPYYSNLIQQTSSKETIYNTNGGNPVTTEQKYFYDNDIHLQRTRTEIVDSNGSILETKIYYPDDVFSTSALNEGGDLSSSEYSMIGRLKSDDLHQISIPIQTITKKNGELLSIQRNLFSNFDTIILPSKIETAKGISDLEDRLIYEDYKNGKPIHVSKKDGNDMVYIWGYNHTYPIAKIENATYTQIAETLGVSVTILKSYNENNLSDLNNLRDHNNMKNVMITTYTYDPLIGVTSITDPRGYTMYYTYDDFNRLQFIKDDLGNIVSKNDYNYNTNN